jgi:hypothetical protein
MQKSTSHFPAYVYSLNHIGLLVRHMDCHSYTIFQNLTLKIPADVVACILKLMLHITVCLIDSLTTIESLSQTHY